MFLPSIQPNLQTCEQYFELLNKLIADSCNGVAGGKPSDFTQLLEQLVMMIKQHPIVEVTSHMKYIFTNDSIDQRFKD